MTFSAKVAGKNKKRAIKARFYKWGRIKPLA
ncbi:hypothetical protein N473_07550 [Pseudoalteromonas luteoviolacea CPMOR-1]|uniref:Uncharacterized protein n=1 Tax=Pseudoalteromonas luteoviolacea CPMOR-1 TaxID=1365248 RepID=A0A167NH77_9GAMM|nr:hypothetical protein N473_07550 [Pseudoalteromonas luteoviolacea CPMOR-1]